MSTDRTLTTSWLAAPLSLLLAASCCTGDDHSSADPAPTADANPPAVGASSPAVVDPHAAAARAQTAGTTKVLQAMDAGTYTYVELDVDGEPTWYAGPKTAVAAGDTVIIPDRTLPMRDFPSAALDRTFELVYFVQSIRKVGEPDVSPERAVEQAHAAAAQRAPTTPSTDIDLTGIPKAEGGMTVAEIFALGKEGAGQDVVLRGRVVKYNANILDKNWLHVRDGSGAEGTNDIIVTTGEIADVGDTVLVRGKLAADRDLGFGYKFDLLIEDAAVTIE